MNKRTTILFWTLLLCTACHNDTPEERVHEILTDQMATLAVAESCTGGTIASRFTALPGASAYFKCGIVTYCNESKCTILNICHDSIASHGAVSEAIVRLMAENTRKIAKADFAIATTGIAGPTGGTPEYPVGSVWIAVATPTHTATRLIHNKGDRNTIITKSGSAAIKLLEEELRND